MLCEAALPVDLFCINYSVIKKGGGGVFVMINYQVY